MNRPINWISGMLALALIGVGTPANSTSLGQGQWQPWAPIQGPWVVTTTPVNCQTGALLTQFGVTSYMTFASAGTLFEENSNASFQPGQRSGGEGYWQHTGRKTYRAYLQAFILFDTVVTDPPATRSYVRGSQSFDHSIAMQDSDHWTSDSLVTFYDTAGARAGGGCAQSSAVRMP